MKTQEELNVLKDEIGTLNKKMAELTEEELAQVTGGQDLKWITLYIAVAPNLGFIGAVADEPLEKK